MRPRRRPAKAPPGSAQGVHRAGPGGQWHRQERIRRHRCGWPGGSDRPQRRAHLQRVGVGRRVCLLRRSYTQRRCGRPGSGRLRPTHEARCTTRPQARRSRQGWRAPRSCR